jgi:hypothetical protein
MNEVVVVAISGWLASFRRRESRMAEITRLELEAAGLDPVFFGRRAIIGHLLEWICCRFIRRHESPKSVLILVGKSLGARTVVRVLNRLGRLRFKRVLLLTVDPCWPIRGDWTPNLNEEELVLMTPVNQGINVYLEAPRDVQCGARLWGHLVENRAIRGCTHRNITDSLAVRRALRELIKEAA